MKWFLILALTMAPGFGAEESARVTLPLAEFQRLSDAGRLTVEEVPVGSVVHRADYAITVSDKFAVAEATWDLETFSGKLLLVPLLANVLLESVEPADASVVRQENGFALLSSQATRRVITARFRIPAEIQRQGSSFSCRLPEAVIARMKLTLSPGLGEASVAGAVNLGEGRWQLGTERLLQIALRPPSAAPEVSVTAVPMPPVVKESRHKMRLVRDGTFLNASTWVIAHDEPIRLPLELGENTEIVSCKVSGVATAPLRRDAKTVEIQLPAGSGPTTVDLTYTGSSSAFEPVRGEFELHLPGTGFLIEALEWELAIPAPFEPVAVEGNCEFLPSSKRQELRLSRELSRGDPARIRVFYQKPDTTKQP